MSPFMKPEYGNEFSPSIQTSKWLRCSTDMLLLFVVLVSIFIIIIIIIIIRTYFCTNHKANKSSANDNDQSNNSNSISISVSISHLDRRSACAPVYTQQNASNK